MSELESKPLSKSEYIEATGVSGNEIVEDKNEALEAAEKVDMLETDRALQVGALEMIGNYYSNLPDGEQMVNRDGYIFDLKNKVVKEIEADLDQQVIDGTMSPRERAQIDTNHEEDIRVRAAKQATNLYKDSLNAAAIPRFKDAYDKMSDNDKAEIRRNAKTRIDRETPGVEPTESYTDQWIIEGMSEHGFGGVDNLRAKVTNDEIMEIADAITRVNVSELDKKITSVYETGKTVDQHHRSEKVQAMVNKYRQRSSN